MTDADFLIWLKSEGALRCVLVEAVARSAAPRRILPQQPWLRHRRVRHARPHHLPAGHQRRLRHQRATQFGRAGRQPGIQRH